MIIHLGGDTGVQSGKIVAILDLTDETLSPDTKRFLRTAKEKGQVRQVAPPPHKSGILTVDKQGTVLYLSPITPVTLMNRAAMNFNVSLLNIGALNNGRND